MENSGGSIFSSTGRHARKKPYAPLLTLPTVLVALPIAAVAMLSVGHAASAQVPPVKEAPRVATPLNDPLIDVVLVPNLSAGERETIRVLNQQLATVPDCGGTPALDEIASVSADAQSLVNEVDKSVDDVVVMQVKESDVKALEEGRLSEAGLILKYQDAQPPTNATDALIIEHTVKTDVSKEALELSSKLAEVESKFGELERAVIEGASDLSTLSDSDLSVLLTGTYHDQAVSEYLRRSSNESGLVGESNGLIDQRLLTELSWAPGFYLHSDAARMFELLNADFKAEMGYDLPIVSTYRPLSVQYEVHAQSPTMTAIPGYSNHGLGLAVDIGANGGFIDYDSPEYVWMLANGHKYGWMHPSWARPEGVMPEPWHFEFGTFYENPAFGTEFNNKALPEYRAYWATGGVVRS